MPIGRLIRKIHCQPRWSVNRPPSSGPATEDTPNTAPKKPWYLPRSRGGMMSPITARASDIRPPPPRPWMARPRIITSMFGDIAQITEPIRNTTIAAW